MKQVQTYVLSNTPPAKRALISSGIVDAFIALDAIRSVKIRLQPMFIVALLHIYKHAFNPLSFPHTVMTKHYRDYGIKSKKDSAAIREILCDNNYITRIDDQERDAMRRIQFYLKSIGKANDILTLADVYKANEARALEMVENETGFYIGIDNAVKKKRTRQKQIIDVSPDIEPALKELPISLNKPEAFKIIQQVPESKRPDYWESVCNVKNGSNVPDWWERMPGATKRDKKGRLVKYNDIGRVYSKSANVQGLPGIVLGQVSTGSGDTAEADIVGCHANIARHENGLPPLPDPHSEVAEAAGVSRSTAKQVANARYYGQGARGYAIHMQDNEHDPRPFKELMAEHNTVVSAMKRCGTHTADHGTLMPRGSRMMHRILYLTHEAGIPVIPRHDSVQFNGPEATENQIIELVDRASFDVFNVAMPLSVKRYRN